MPLFILKDIIFCVKVSAVVSESKKFFVPKQGYPLKLRARAAC